jgi:Streptomyces sporulation and cell division protein, SsgA
VDARPDRSELAAVPARVFVLGSGLDVEVADCVATLWRRGRDAPILHLLLSRGVGDTVTVAVGADLVAAGLHGRAEDGPVTVWPEDDLVCIGLPGPSHSVLELPYESVADLVEDAQRASRSARKRSARG